jgi:hypothetical protein
MASFQNIYIVDEKYDANAKAYLIEEKYNADIIGSVVDTINDADMKLYIVNNEFEANIKLFLETKKSDGCFISTACVKSKGLPDDCYELTTLRKFRDEYLLKTNNGRKIIKEYYKVAPLIVKNLSKHNDVKTIYDSLYENLIRTSIKYIEMNEMEKAKLNYMYIISNLKEHYLIEPVQKGANFDKK